MGTGDSEESAGRRLPDDAVQAVPRGADQGEGRHRPGLPGSKYLVLFISYYFYIYFLYIFILLAIIFYLILLVI